MTICKTERLTIRTFDHKDAAFILELLNTPTWLKYIGNRNINSEEDARNYLENGPMKSYTINGFGLWMVELNNRKPIGMCGLIRRDGLTHPDIGFAFLPEFAGKGYGYESASAVLKYAKDSLELTHIMAITNEENEASIALLNKLGLRYSQKIRLQEDEDILLLFELPEPAPVK